MAVTDQSDGPVICLGGDGIASRSMALALAQSGFKSTIIAPQIDGHKKGQTGSQSGGMQLAPNGWAALKTLGLADLAMETIATPLSMMRVMSLDTGFNLTQIPLNTTLRRKPYTSISRQGLGDILLNACKDSQKVTWKSGQISAITSRDDKAIISLDQGKDITADWLFGGDGASGLCRRYVSAEDDHNSDQSRSNFTRKAFRIVIDGDICPPALMGHGSNIWLGDGGHIVHYPISSKTHGHALNLVIVTHKATAIDDLPQMLKHHPQGGFLADYITDHHDEIFEQPLYRFNALDALQRGRVILTGDAAHPMPPHLAQGAGQTLVDAAVMMDILKVHAEIDPSLRQAFTKWSGQRNREAKAILHDAERAGEIFALDGPLAKIRNLGLATIGGRIMTDRLEKIWSS